MAINSYNSYNRVKLLNEIFPDYKEVKDKEYLLFYSLYPYKKNEFFHNNNLLPRKPYFKQEFVDSENPLSLTYREHTKILFALFKAIHSAILKGKHYTTLSNKITFKIAKLKINISNLKYKNVDSTIKRIQRTQNIEKYNDAKIYLKENKENITMSGHSYMTTKGYRFKGMWITRIMFMYFWEFKTSYNVSKRGRLNRATLRKYYEENPTYIDRIEHFRVKNKIFNGYD